MVTAKRCVVPLNVCAWHMSSSSHPPPSKTELVHAGKRLFVYKEESPADVGAAVLRVSVRISVGGCWFGASVSLRTKGGRAVFGQDGICLA